MLKRLDVRSWSPVSALAALNGALIVLYLGLIATAMVYAALEVEFTQYTNNDEAAVAGLESQYFASLAAITTINYTALGYATPVAEIFVPSAPQTAINIQ